MTWRYFDRPLLRWTREIVITGVWAFLGGRCDRWRIVEGAEA